MGVAGTAAKTGTLEGPVKPKEKRKHIWEIENKLYCSICGTCMDMEEQKEILKKLKINPELYSDYEIHGLMVENLNAKNKLSYQVDKHLNRKYRYEIAEFGGYGERDLLKVWQEKLESGDICGLFWVAVTHPRLSWETLIIMFSEVHMLSHLNGGSTRREKAECKRLSDFNARLSIKLKEEKKAKKILNRDLEQLKRECRQLQDRLRSFSNNTNEKKTEVEGSDRAVSDLKKEKDELKRKLCQAKEEVDELMRLIRLFNREKDKLILELSEQKELNIQLYREIENILKQLKSGTANCGKRGSDLDLCARRVLIVGGLTKLRGFYRDMIEKMGGEFEYHDGYLQSGAKTLEDSIKRSDIVLCPVDCNSHGACLSVKKICKKFNKSYQILPGSSLSSISQALSTGGEGQ